MHDKGEVYMQIFGPKTWRADTTRKIKA